MRVHTVSIGSIVIAVMTAAAASMASDPAFADRWHGRGRVGIGVYVGPPWGYPYPYYPGYYYPPAVVAVPTEPPQYIEKSDMATGDADEPEDQGYWYHCAKPEGYYPYVKTCSSGWQKVPAVPPSPAQNNAGVPK
ncbi:MULTISPECIES: hypothetical protein [Ralstonia]|jgi:hypothetical protein|uniref:Lipoprotein n=1 Tax=Ralstonia flaminis TaxID=3058597 RepID=A0ABN9JUF1_9RALS|nr:MULTISPECIES: hypothetical protein [unclassified Ralstonia]CAJ0822728.1 hypothetical protein LMG18101_05153 [Ralstonia sp. LMG 18101]